MLETCIFPKFSKLTQVFSNNNCNFLTQLFIFTQNIEKTKIWFPNCSKAKDRILHAELNVCNLIFCNYEGHTGTTVPDQVAWEVFHTSNKKFCFHFFMWIRTPCSTYTIYRLLSEVIAKTKPFSDDSDLYKVHACYNILLNVYSIIRVKWPTKKTRMKSYRKYADGIQYWRTWVLFCTYGVNIFIDYLPACRDTEKGGVGGRDTGTTMR